MDDRELARYYGLGRAAIGLVILLMPRRIGAGWTGDRHQGALAGISMRGLGARDVAIGVGTLVALDNDLPVKGWVQAGAIADAGDAVGTFLELRRMPKPRGLFWCLFAATFSVLGFSLSESLD